MLIKDPLEDFQQLNDFTHIYQPQTDSNPSTGPHLVILCSWAFAQPRHISKYLRSYQERYPEAQILLIQSDTGNLLWRPDAWQMPMFNAAVSTITDYLQQTTSKSAILLHVFSNGGSYTAIQLANAYRRTHAQLPPSDNPHDLPINAIIFDSSPSPPRLSLGIKAISMGLPRSRLANYLGKPIISLSLSIFAVLHELRISELAMAKAYRESNAVPFLKEDVPRAYVYSKVDAVMGEEDILAHARAARGKLGVGEGDVDGRVRTEEFVGSSHVNHMAVDVERYWGIVSETWEQGVKLQGGI